MRCAGGDPWGCGCGGASRSPRESGGGPSEQGVFSLQVAEQKVGGGGHLVQEESVAGGVGQNGHGLVDGVASQEHPDGCTVLPHDGLVESDVEVRGWAFFQGLGPVGHQLPAASLGYVSHEQNFKEWGLGSSGDTCDRIGQF